jgi:hypothetical protein
MATTQLSLLGVIPQDLYTALIERLSTQAELGEAYALSESMYSRGAVGSSHCRGRLADPFLQAEKEHSQMRMCSD